MEISKNLNPVELYFPSLEGLRVIAFISVFISHFPPPKIGTIMIGLHGWGGVDLFFALSSYLLLVTMQREFYGCGKVDLLSFFIRRMLRIQPLMIVYTVATILLLSSNSMHDWLRLGGLMIGLDNIFFVSGLIGSSAPYARHLWSLSYEFQIYALLPLIFFARQRLEDRHFALLICTILSYGIAARMIANGLDAKHPFVYRLPIFRPESFLVGVALWSIRPQWDVRNSFFIGIVSWLGFVLMPQPWDNQIAGLFSYPALALACGAAIDSTLRIRQLKLVLGSSLCVYLGKRSFGFYVFHLVSGDLGYWIAKYFDLPEGTLIFWFIASTVGLIFCVAFSDISFRILESPFNSLADRLRPRAFFGRLESRSDP